jgi:hypothetical protein
MVERVAAGGPKAVGAKNAAVPSRTREVIRRAERVPTFLGVGVGSHCPGSRNPRLAPGEGMARRDRPTPSSPASSLSPGRPVQDRPAVGNVITPAVRRSP